MLLHYINNNVLIYHLYYSGVTSSVFQRSIFGHGPRFFPILAFFSTIIDVHADGNHIKWIPSTSSHKDAVLGLGYIYKFIIVYIYWYCKMHQTWFFCKIIYFHVFLIFPVLDENKLYPYILAATLFQLVISNYF